MIYPASRAIYKISYNFICQLYLNKTEEKDTYQANTTHLALTSTIPTANKFSQIKEIKKKF